MKEDIFVQWCGGLPGENRLGIEASLVSVIALLSFHNLQKTVHVNDVDFRKRNIFQNIEMLII